MLNLINILMHTHFLSLLLHFVLIQSKEEREITTYGSLKILNFLTN